MENTFLQKVCDELKTALSDFGWTATIDKERIDRYHRVGGDIVIYQEDEVSKKYNNEPLYYTISLCGIYCPEDDKDWTFSFISCVSFPELQCIMNVLSNNRKVK